MTTVLDRIVWDVIWTNHCAKNLIRSSLSLSLNITLPTILVDVLPFFSHKLSGNLYTAFLGGTGSCCRIDSTNMNDCQNSELISETVTEST